MVKARMLGPSDAAFAEGVKWVAALANRHGITGVIDARDEERHVRVYQALAHDLTLRVAAARRAGSASIRPNSFWTG